MGIDTALVQARVALSNIAQPELWSAEAGLAGQCRPVVPVSELIAIVVGALLSRDWEVIPFTFVNHLNIHLAYLEVPVNLYVRHSALVHKTREVALQLDIVPGALLYQFRVLCNHENDQSKFEILQLRNILSKHSAKKSNKFPLKIAFTHDNEGCLSISDINSQIIRMKQSQFGARRRLSTLTCLLKV